MPRRRPPPAAPWPRLLLGGLVLLAVLLLARGIGGNLGWFAPTASTAPAVSPVAAPQPAAPSPASQPVAPGSGTFTADAPSSTEPTQGAALCSGCDVVLITVCSLRKDHVSAYGAGLAATPAIDTIAAGGHRFQRAYAASNFTLASLTAVLTGRFGSSTGVIGWDKGLVEDIHTLPEVLGLYGYRTAAFTTDAPSGFRPDYGLDRGFQRMEIYPAPRGTPDGRHRGGEPGPPGETAAPVVSWLSEQDTGQPLFVMFHTRTAHFPFVVSSVDEDEDPTGITRLLWEAGMNPARSQAMPGMAGGTAQKGIVEFGEDPLQTRINTLGAPAEAVWRQRYAESVALMDADVAAVLAAVAQRGRPTVIALVADHGESLNDHSELLHGDAYFDGVINVPMLINVPGMAGGVHSALASQVDLLPTLLEIVGAVPPSGIDGVSLLPMMQRDEAVRGTALAEGGVANQVGEHPVGAVIAPPWALLRQNRGCGPTSPARVSAAGAPPTCLFHMDRDPGQLHSVAAENPDVVADLLSRWEGFRQTSRQARELELSPAFIEELRRNGYDFRLGAP